MELGLNLDDLVGECDDNSEEPRSYLSDVQTYIPRTVEPFQWITTTSIEDDPCSWVRVNSLRCEASMYLLRGDYGAALEKYRMCMQESPQGNPLHWKDVCESYAHCLIKLGRNQEAKLFLEEVSPQATNSNDIGLPLLKMQTHINLSAYNQVMLALFECIDVHPDLPDYWIYLGIMVIADVLASLDSNFTLSLRSSIGAKPKDVNNEIDLSVDEVALIELWSSVVKTAKEGIPKNRSLEVSVPSCRDGYCSLSSSFNKAMNTSSRTSQRKERIDHLKYLAKDRLLHPFSHNSSPGTSEKSGVFCWSYRCTDHYGEFNLKNTVLGREHLGAIDAFHYFLFRAVLLFILLIFRGYSLMRGTLESSVDEFLVPQQRKLGALTSLINTIMDDDFIFYYLISCGHTLLGSEKCKYITNEEQNCPYSLFIKNNFKITKE